MVPELVSAEDKLSILRKQDGFREDGEAAKKCVERLGDAAGVGVKRLILDAKLSKFKADQEGVPIDVAFAENLYYREKVKL